MTGQIPLDLPHRPSLGRSDFFVSEANAAAVAAIDAWQGWPRRRMVLTGPEGAGKTHLMHVWATAAGAQILTGAALAQADLPGLAGAGPLGIDDAEACAGSAEAESALFHLLNLCGEAGTSVLLAARSAPARWPVVLPDLASRLQAIATAPIAAPDDALLEAVLVKLFADRQLRVGARLIGYLTRRMERSLAAAGRIVAAIDALALAEGRAPGPDIAARVLDSEAHRAP